MGKKNSPKAGPRRKKHKRMRVVGKEPRMGAEDPGLSDWLFYIRQGGELGKWSSNSQYNRRVNREKALNRKNM